MDVGVMAAGHAGVDILHIEVAEAAGSSLPSVMASGNEHSAMVLMAQSALIWRGPFDPDHDALWQDMQAGHISERNYWLLLAREVGRLLGQDWAWMAHPNPPRSAFVSAAGNGSAALPSTVNQRLTPKRWASVSARLTTTLFCPVALRKGPRLYGPLVTRSG